MSSREWSWVDAVVICVVLGVAIFAWPVKSYFEAKSYNAATGSNVSTWEAMWVELRVEGRPK